jgi:lipase
VAAATTLRTPLGRRVKVVAHGTGAPVVFLHSGVGSAGEWKQVCSVWPEGYRLVAIETYRDGTGPRVAGRRSRDDYSDQVYAVAEHVGVPVCVVGFSWSGATASAWLRRRPSSWTRSPSSSLRHTRCCARRTPTPTPRSVACAIGGAHVRAGRWYEAFEEFVDFYNGPGSFARWPPPRRQAFLGAQKARGDLWNVLFDDLLIEGAGHMMPLTHPEPVTRALLTRIER